MSKDRDQYLMQCFAYEGLTDEQANVARPFHELAQYLFKLVPDCGDRVAALQKLLEARECAIRGTFKE